MKTRLYDRTRGILRDHALSKIVCPIERDAEQTAFNALTVLVDPLAELYFPLRHMEVLERYRLAGVRGHLEVKPPDSDRRCVHLPVSHPRLFPVGLYGDSGYHAIEVTPDDPVWPAFRLWREAKQLHAQARDRVYFAYNVLITASRNFEDVVAVWPEAQEMAEQVGQRGQNALSPINADLIARIKADVAARTIATTPSES